MAPSSTAVSAPKTRVRGSARAIAMTPTTIPIDAVIMTDPVAIDPARGMSPLPTSPAISGVTAAATKLKMLNTALQHNLHSSDGFVEILTNSDEWQTIDDLVAICDQAGYWEVDFEYRALTDAKKTRIRKVVSKLKDEDGFPLFP